MPEECIYCGKYMDNLNGEQFCSECTATARCPNCGEWDRLYLPSNNTNEKLCRVCYFRVSFRKPMMMQPPSVKRIRGRVAQAEADCRSEPTDMEKILTLQNVKNATEDLLQMKKELETDCDS